MLKNNLRIFMGERRIDNIKDLMELTGLSRNSLNKLWRDSKVETINLGTLIKICDALEISLSDLIEYVPGSPSSIIRTPVMKHTPKEE